MATVIPTITRINDGKALKAVWLLTTADNDGLPMGARFLDYPNRTVYFSGTWGGATGILEGGDGTTYLPLTGPAGTAISKTADGIDGNVAQVPEFARPRLSVVGVAASITVTVIARK